MWPPPISSVMSASSCMNCCRIAPCVLLTGSKIAAPESPIDVVINSPANSAAPITSDAARPMTNPTAVSARNVAGVMRNVSMCAVDSAAGSKSTAKMTSSAVRKRMGTTLADHAGATSSRPPTRNAVSSKAAGTPGAKRSGRPNAFTRPSRECRESAGSCSEPGLAATMASRR